MKKPKNNIAGIGKLGVKFIIKDELNQSPRKILFPEKLEEANKILNKLKDRLPK